MVPARRSRAVFDLTDFKSEVWEKIRTISLENPDI